MLPLLLLILGTRLGHADTLEPYSNRPSVLEAAAINHLGTESSLPPTVPAHVWAAVFFTEMYRGQTLFFIGRDAEQLFDVTLLLSVDRPHPTPKLINVSRDSRFAANLGGYLRDQAFDPDLGPVLIDTGHTDKIPNAIAWTFPPERHAAVRAHYLSSNLPQIPSFRLFGHLLNPAKPSQIMQGYEEGFHHYTQTAEGYGLVNGRWEALSPRPNPADREVRRRETQVLQEQWKYWLNLPSVRAEVAAARAFFGQLYDLSLAGKTTDVIRHVRAFMLARGPAGEAFARDYLELLRLNGREVFPLRLRESDLGLPEDADLVAVNDLVAATDAGRTGALGNLECAQWRIAYRFFLRPGAERFEPDLLRLLAMCEPSFQEAIATDVFSQPHAQPMTTALDWLIDHGTVLSRQRLIEGAFSRPHARGWSAQATRVLAKATGELPRKFATYALATPNVLAFQEALSLGVRGGDPAFIFEVLGQVFDKPWTDPILKYAPVAIARVPGTARNALARQISTLRERCDRLL